MLSFFSIIFLASLFGIWYFWRKKPNKRLLTGTIAVAVISFLTIGGLNDPAKDATTQSTHSSSIAKKESATKAKKASRAKESSEAKASSLAKESSESLAQESSIKAESERQARAESESLAQAESQRIEQENSARAESQKAQQESVAAVNTETTQVAQPNNGGQTAPVNNGDLNTADANAQGVIVGNANSMIYHVPGQRGYRMNSANAVYFNSEAEAQAAGYRKSLR